jgi:IS30 family transposase
VQLLIKYKKISTNLYFTIWEWVMGQYSRHLQAEDRITLYELLFSGLSISEIAEFIGVHKTTIYRELHRNSSNVGYRPDLAQQAYTRRKQIKPSKLSRHPALQNFIIEKLTTGWSPELIAGYLKRKTGYSVINHETIYRFIYSPEGLKLKLYRHLMRKRRFRYPRIKRRRRIVADPRHKKHFSSCKIDSRYFDKIHEKK